MAAAPEIDVKQGTTLAIAAGPAVNIAAPAARVLAVYNVPTLQMNASFAGITIPYRRISVSMQMQVARMVAVIRGRTANPKVRAWTFTLDGHDFYVLRLGDQATLLYDVATEQWTEWTSGDLPVWRARTGTNWTGGAALAHFYGSNVIVGDDTYGLLWFLDPDQAFDDHPDETATRQQIPFPRIVTGQVLASGRQYMPCYAIFVDGDNYGLTATDFVPAITLATSDDQGRTFYDHDTLDVAMDTDENNPYSWYSLGQVNSPGRIFRVSDNGVFARIDSMEMNDDGG